MGSNERTEEIATAVVDAAFKVHSTLGPGLLESIYEAALVLELRNRGFRAATQVPVAVVYEGQDLGIGFRADIVVEDLLIIEVKSVEAIQPVHLKQLLTYLKVTGKKLGVLIDFNERVIKNSIRRVINEI